MAKLISEVEVTVEALVSIGPASPQVPCLKTSRAATVTVDEVCGAMRRCVTTMDQETCVMGTARDIERAESVACARESDRAHHYDRAADEGMCEAASIHDAALAFTNCLREGGGLVMNFACDRSSASLSQCMEVTGSVVADPAAVCGDGTLGESCPAGDVIGRCTSVVLGTTMTTTYYAPLPTGVTVENLEGICSGSWTVGP